ncbi:hybrid sensor histidine kinase/response regulator [Lichenifustis flavocetrariae]|uniref:histidine kinase n=1 Tax=Lichenifustis flavocetrariae TaxID=2949735 RepID=A0AA41YVR0_9HYPH|nr:ATP-binding protein [Lichenifustis flavocetrariae]MCW6508017.1 ATP-binding protein [Lichenifustis flavocetrariae]
MSGRQRILPVRRDYNRWVANETLEDFALRFTAKSARKWSAPRVSQTAIGAISFLALEAIGGAITLSFGFSNVFWATLVVGTLLFLTGMPISRYAARYGVDIDLLTRGAGFGYIGSTVTSLVYATFTFILFAIEATIMATALQLVFGLPLAWGYLLSAVAVIPLVTYGIAWISRFQLVTQPLWIVLNVLPIGFIVAHDWPAVVAWTHFPGLGHSVGSFDLLKFGGAASVILALMPQIGEQVDVLRFLPARPENSRRWTASLLAAGPGWIVLGAPKLMFGSLLAYLCLQAGVPAEHAAEPAQMYRLAFATVLPWPQVVALLTAAFVVVSQLKINVMNAYAGSLAWSNFFSRLTHSHPGRVVWLVFNVAIALLLMELGIYAALERILSLFAVVAVAWLGAIVADLAINKPLGLSPPGIEFKRAHLYDINPVGTGAMGLAAFVALISATGTFGPLPEALAPFIALGVALVAAPVIAALTRGRFYLARKPRAEWLKLSTITCSVCTNPFEPEDMAYCPAYAAPICSLCCSLDARCHDLCKPQARAQTQIAAALRAMLPSALSVRVNAPTLHYLGVFVPLIAIISLALLLIDVHAASQGSLIKTVVDQTLWGAFAILFIVSGVLAWFFVLAAESRRVAQEESARQTTLLLQEIEAHKKTDAALQKAKEVAEAANHAKSRYVVGLSHELRTPLNAVLGYAQLLERDGEAAAARQNGVRVIRRSAEHLSGLIDGLLDVSKIEAGRLQIQRNEVRTTEFFAGLVDMFRLQAAAKGLEFRFTGIETLPAVVRTDEKRLRQILINLLSNAVKFTPAGHVGLAIMYRNQVATLVVEDSGPGIPVANIERIFEPFDRGALSGAEAVPGLGLGLTITKLLTELMGGAIAVRSTVGAGSTFEVRLMLASVAVPLPEVARNVQGYAGPRRTLLVVDDDGDHQALMRALLEPLGFSVLSARDGPTCLALVADVRPDLFLLDVSMPGMSGWELADALRTLRRVTAPIVMLSANIGDGAPQPLLGLAHDAVLAKPFVVATLLDTLARCLGLTWIERQDHVVAPALPIEPHAIPEPGVVAELQRLGAIGHVRGIEAKLDELAGNPNFTALAGRLRDHVRAFDFPAYEAVLEAFGERVEP